MGDNLRRLLLREPAIHRPVKVVGNLRDLTGSNQSANGNQASVPRCKVRAQPQITKKKLRRVLHNPRSH